MTVTHGVSATRGGTTCETAGHGRGRQGQLPEAKASPGTPGEHGRLWGTGPQGHQAPWEAAPRSGRGCVPGCPSWPAAFALAEPARNPRGDTAWLC